MKRNILAVAVVMASAFLAGLGVAQVTASPDSLSAAPIAVSYYESPCYYKARTSRGIPPLTLDQARGLIAWERDNAGTLAATEYHAALRDCDATAPVGKWNWDGMFLAHSELG